MKQTVVEWLMVQLETYGDPEYCKIEWETLDELIKQALEMEKNQSIKFGKIVGDKWGMIPIPLENIKEKYNETFKSE